MRKAIAIDFDGCLCTNAYPEIGEPNWPVIKRAQAEQRAGAGLILWTCREDQLLLDAIAACEGWGLTFDAVNESLPDWIEEFKTRPRKVGASEYWDDKAVQIPLPSNPPLTLDELREMSGEPVWVTYGDSWKICYGLTDYRGYLCMETGGGSYICMDHYGKGWWAYRHKLEEGTS